MSSKATTRKPAPRKPAAKRAPKPQRAKQATRPTAAKKATGVQRSEASPASKRRPPAEQPGSPSKQSQLIALLRSPAGGTIAAMTALTGWQPHTVRGTISGVFRKKLKLNVACVSEDGGRVYRIIESAA